MSKYTTEVRFICETMSGLKESVGYSNVDEVIEKSRSKIFDFSYPIFNEEYRPVLETKILMHYYTREICAETVGLWKLFLKARMNEIMPYYNKLYDSELIKFDPMWDVDLTTEHGKQNNGGRNTHDTGTGTTTYSDVKTGSSNENKWDLYSDTPQGGVNGIEQAYDNVANNAYLTNADHITDNIGTTENDNSTTNSSTENHGAEAYTDTESFLEHVVGKRGGMTYSKMLEEFRKTFLNIDMLIIKELEDLFFMLW